MPPFQSRDEYERWKRARAAGDPTSTPHADAPSLSETLRAPVAENWATVVSWILLAGIILVSLWFPALFLVIALGLIPAVIAHRKGLNFAFWWLYGTALLLAALPHVILTPGDEGAVERQQIAAGQKKCPFCAEMIKGDARVCRYCGRDLPA